MAYSNYLALSPLTMTYRLGMLVLAVLLAVLSWRYVETPFRTRAVGTSRKAMFGYAGGGLAVMLGMGVACVMLQGVPQRYSQETLEFANAKLDWEFRRETKLEDAVAGKFISLGVNDTNQSPTVFVWGDSHAQAALPAIDSLLKENGLVGEAASCSSTTPTVDWSIRHALRWNSDPITYNNEVFQYIKRKKISNVILIARWPSHISSSDDYISTDRNGQLNSLAPAVLNTIKQLVDIGCCPWVMLSVPEHPFDVPRVLTRYAWANNQIKLYCSKPGDQRELSPELVAEIEAAGGRVIDPKPRFLDPTENHYIIQSEGTALYRDDDHLSAKGSRLMLLPFFREVLTFRSVTPSDNKLQTMDLVTE